MDEDLNSYDSFSPAPDFKPTFPIEEVMGHIVTRSADKLWGAVATTVSAKGVEDTVPKTDEDWERVRDYAVTLVEATNIERPYVGARNHVDPV